MTMSKDSVTRLHMTSTHKGYYVGDDNTKKFFTVINDKVVFDDLLESSIYRDRAQPIYDFIRQ